MASPSFPFPVSTTAPASGISPAPSYIPYMFPYAATYHHTFPSPIPTQFDPNRPPPAAAPIHGDLHNSPFPFFYSPPPAFPYAATYPYPPPTSAYTPEFGFSPNQPIWPPPAPDPIPLTTTSTTYASSSGLSSTAGHVPSKVAAAQAQAQAAEEEQIRARLPREVLNTNRRLDHLQHSFDLLQSHASRLKEMVAQIGAALGKQPAPSTAPSSPAPSPKPATTTQSAASVSNEFYGVLSLQSSLCGRPKQQQHKEGGSGGDLTMGTNTSGTSINGKKPIDKQPGPEILSMDHAGSTYHFAPTPSSVLDLDKSYGWQSEIQQGNTSGSPALPVFNEMPTPSSWQGKHGTAPNYSSWHHNQIQSSCVSNLSEQNLEMTQSYGFNNLKRGTVFLADGSEHSFYALPEDYPLERATSEPVSVVYDDETDGSSTEFGDMFTSSSDQLTISFHTAPENASSTQVKGFSKAPETEHAGACLNITSDMQNFTLELQQQDDEKACTCPVLKASDSVVTSSSQLSSEHSMGELRLLWDPGAHTIPGSTTNRDIHCNFRLPTRLINHGILFLWDPGILSLRDMTLGTTVVPHQLHSRQTPYTLVILDQPVDMKHFLFQLLLQYNWWCHIPNAFLEVQYCYLPSVLDCSYSEPIQQLVCYSCMFSSTEAIHFALSMSTARTVRMILVLCSNAIAQEGRDATVVYHASKFQLQMRKTSQIWDPGIDSLLFLSIWLHVHMIQLVGCSAIHVCYLVSALLPPTQFADKGPSNIELGVKKYCNAKKLPSSHNCLQIWEMDIIYITFLPP